MSDVQAVLDDPREGDVFHEMYSYGVQVLCVDDTHVGWRSFGREELGRGWTTREEWSKSFRYGNPELAGKHTMQVMRRGDPAEEEAAEPPADALTIAGVEFEVSGYAGCDSPRLTIRLMGSAGDSYLFTYSELGALAAWLKDHAEAGER